MLCYKLRFCCEGDSLGFVLDEMWYLIIEKLKVRILGVKNEYQRSHDNYTNFACL